MGLHRAEADEQRVGDLLVGLPPRHALQHVQFAPGQRDDERAAGRFLARQEPAEQRVEPVARRCRLDQAQVLAGLRQQQLAQGFQLILALVLQQLAKAMAAGKLQRLFEAAEGLVARAAILGEAGLEQQHVEQQAVVGLRLRLFLEVGADSPGLVVLPQVALHPGIGQPLLGQQVLAVAAPAVVPLREPVEEEVLVVLAHGHARAPGAGLAMQGEQPVLPGHAADLIPAHPGLSRFALRPVQAGLVVEHPGQGGAMGEVQRHHLGLVQELAGLLQLIGLQHHQALSQMREQFVEAPRGAGRRLAVHIEEALPGRCAAPLGQLDLAEQQLREVGVAAEAKAPQLAEGQFGLATGLFQASEGGQATGAFEMQHRAGRVVLGIAPQGTSGHVHAVRQVTAQIGQPAAQEGDGLPHPLRMARVALASEQPLQAPEALGRLRDVVGHDHGGRFGDGQGEAVAAGMSGDFAEKIHQGVDLALAQQVEGVPVDDAQHGVQIPGATELVDGLGKVAAFQQPVRRLPVQLPQALRIALFQALVEAAAQDRVVAVLAALARPLFDEQRHPAQFADRLAGVGVAAELAGQGGIESLDHRRPFEKALQLGRQMAQALFFEELSGMGIGARGDRPQVGGRLPARCRGLAVGVEPEQHAADPALAAGPQLVDRIGAQVHVAGRGQLAGFLAVQGQLIGVDQRQPRVAAQVRQRQPGRALAGGEQAQRRRREVQQLFEVSIGKRRTQQMQVVDQQGQWFAGAFQAVLDFAPQVVGRRCRPDARRHPERRMQVQEQAERLVLGGGQAQPGAAAGQGAGELPEQGALAVAQRSLEQGEAAGLDRIGKLPQQARAGEGFRGLGGST
ncbi:hypothetical protein D3C78_529550 [compost metagenome]